ncbi:MAG: 30S ribosomal protein S24e [Methanonatronarchaeales archaeon]|nr:30S ribosomal protein S24e [Methanonatronarchaeales archaeon]
MEIEVTGEWDNALLGRRQLDFSVEHPGDATPGRTDVRKKLAAMKDADENLVIVKGMDTDFGRAVTDGSVSVYSSRDRMVEVESRHLLDRNLGEDQGTASTGREERAGEAGEPEEEAPEPEAGGEGSESEEEPVDENEAEGEDESDAGAEEADEDPGEGGSE